MIKGNDGFLQSFTRQKYHVITLIGKCDYFLKISQVVIFPIFENMTTVYRVHIGEASPIMLNFNIHMGDVSN